MKKLSSLIAVLLMATLVFACFTPQALAADSKVIGVSMSTFEVQFFQAEVDVIKEVAEANGFTIDLAICDLDANKQMTQIEDMINKGVAAVICCAQDASAIVASVEACKAADIPFIAMGKPPTDMTNVTAAILVDGIESAKVAADTIKDQADKLGYTEVKVMEIVGDLNDQNAVQRHEGFVKRAEELGFAIVASIPTEWNLDLCQQRFTDAITTDDDFNAVYCPSDFMLTSVISVLKENKMLVKNGEPGHIIIVTIDGDPYGMQQVMEGYNDATINTDAFDFGRLAAQAAVDLINGVELEDQIIWVPNVPLTRENIPELGETIWGGKYKLSGN